LFAVSRWIASRRIVQLECLSEDAGRRGVGQLPARAPRRIAESDVGTERARSLGTFNILSLLAAARERELPHVYLGYYVEGCRSMEYKRKFRPNEVLGADGAWETFDAGCSSVIP
jgi:Arginine-tRNA-protein transferase, C terminus